MESKSFLHCDVLDVHTMSPLHVFRRLGPEFRAFEKTRARPVWTATLLQCVLGLVSVDSILKKYFQNSQAKSNYVKSTDVE